VIWYRLTSPYLLLCLCHTHFFRLCALYFSTILLSPVTLLHVLHFQLLASILLTSANPSLSILSTTSPPAAFSLLPLPLLTANVCDEEMLLCQNGGTCYQNQKCICPPEFKGILCQHSRCEAGKDCNGATSLHLSTATLLLCTLLTYLLATLSPHWATKSPPKDRWACVYECLSEGKVDPEWGGPNKSWTPMHMTALL